MRGKIFLSLIVGGAGGAAALVVGLLLAPEIAIWLGLLAFALIAIAMHVILSITEVRLNKQYAKIERTLQSPVIYQTIANFNLGGSVVHGKVYLCRDGIVFATIEHTPYAVQKIPSDQLARYEQDEIHLRLYTKDGKEYHLVLPDAPEVVRVIKENYWN